MAQRRMFRLTLAVAGLVLALVAFGLLLSHPAVRALPPAGSDNVYVSADVSMVSRLGTETVHFTGTATISRSDPYENAGAEVIDTEIVALSLTGQSLTGTVTASQSGTNASLGQIRGTGPAPAQFPASSFFDVFVDIAVPGSPNGPITVHNDKGFHLVAMEINSWPPYGVKYGLEPPSVTPSPTPTGTRPATPAGTPECLNGILLQPALPGAICVTGVTVVLSNGPVPTATDTGTPTPTGSPTATMTVTETPTPTGTPTSTPTVTPTRTPTTTLTPTSVPAPWGDSNCSGRTDAVDATLVLQLEAGLISSLNCQPRADVNRDGRVDVLDAELILQFVAGLLGSLPL